MSRLLFAVTLGVFCLWFFASVLVGTEVFASRDAAHFYAPLFEFERNEWAAGRVPLWNPYEMAGVPLAADATASVFYPGKLIFALPIGFLRAFALYIVAHVALAAVTANYLARRLETSREAATLAGLSYSFGGIVLYQYANVVFLVGAAWLPAALAAAHRLLVERRVLSSATFGAILALMVLGGDPQMAYHAVLLTALYALILRWRRAAPTSVGAGARSINTRDARKPTITWRANRLVLIVAACGIGILLSAVQILPSIELTRRSTRAVYESPRSVYEAAGEIFENHAPTAAPENRESSRHMDGLLHRNVSSGTHDASRYAFSVGPWRYFEFIWPGVSGRQFPTHRRWIEAVPAERDPWVPSLYMGVLPLLFAPAVFRLRRGEARDRWMSWTLVIALAAALGVFGPGWAMRQLQLGYGVLTGSSTAAAGGTQTIAADAFGDPVGGVYWLFGVLLPGYVYFRFPAKWLVVAALALSILAARGFDSDRAGALRRAKWLCAMSLVALAVFVAVTPWWESVVGQPAADALYGPFDSKGAHFDVAGAFAHTAIIAAIAWWLLAFATKTNRERSKYVGPAIILLAASDLALANAWLIDTAPASVWAQRSEISQHLAKIEKAVDARAPVRVHRLGGSVAPSWRERFDSQRSSEAVLWWRETLWPKLNLRERVGVIESRSSFVPFEYQTFIEQAQRPDAWLGTNYIRESEQYPLDSMTALSDSLPRCWIVHDVETIAPLETGDAAAIRRRTEQIFKLLPAPADRRTRAVVEVAGEWNQPNVEPARELKKRSDSNSEAPPQPDAKENCEIVHYEPSRVEIEATLSSPGLVVLSDYDYPGWTAEVLNLKTGESPKREILRTNRIMRGVWLDEGHYRLVYRYRPRSVLAGAVVSAAAWIALAALLWRSRRRGFPPIRAVITQESRAIRARVHGPMIDSSFTSNRVVTSHEPFDATASI